jgi:hypothetical protein
LTRLIKLIEIKEGDYFEVFAVVLSNLKGSTK